MNIQKHQRIFAVGNNCILLTHVLTLNPKHDELVTFTTESGSSIDIVRKSWGYYLTGSLNQRLLAEGFHTFLCKNKKSHNIFVLAIDQTCFPSFLSYCSDEDIEVIQYLSVLDSSSISRPPLYLSFLDVFQEIYVLNCSAFVGILEQQLPHFNLIIQRVTPLLPDHTKDKPILRFLIYLVGVFLSKDKMLLRNLILQLSTNPFHINFSIISLKLIPFLTDQQNFDNRDEILIHLLGAIESDAHINKTLEDYNNHYNGHYLTPSQPIDIEKLQELSFPSSKYRLSLLQRPWSSRRSLSDQRLIKLNNFSPFSNDFSADYLSPDYIHTLEAKPAEINTLFVNKVCSIFKQKNLQFSTSNRVKLAIAISAERSGSTFLESLSHLSCRYYPLQTPLTIPSTLQTYVLLPFLLWHADYTSPEYIDMLANDVAQLLVSLYCEVLSVNTKTSKTTLLTCHWWSFYFPFLEQIFDIELSLILHRDIDLLYHSMIAKDQIQSNPQPIGEFQKLIKHPLYTKIWTDYYLTAYHCYTRLLINCTNSSFHSLDLCPPDIETSLFLVTQLGLDINPFVIPNLSRINYKYERR